MNFEDQAAKTARLIEGTLSALRVPAKVQKVIRGPTVTQYDLRPASHVRIRGIEQVLDDLTVALSAKSLRLLKPVTDQPFISLVSSLDTYKAWVPDPPVFRATNSQRTQA